MATTLCEVAMAYDENSPRRGAQALNGDGLALPITEVQAAGVTAWLVEDHSLPLISVRFFLRDAGSASDPEGRSGLAAMTASLLNEGAGDYDARRFRETLEENGVRLSFSAGRDTLGGSLKTLTARRRQAFTLLGLALSAPRFDKENVETARRQTLTSLADDEQDAATVARKLWYARAFAGHPYAHGVDGDADSVRAITRRDLTGFVTRHFGRNRLVVGVAGDITPQQLAEALGEAFSALPAQAQPVQRSVPEALACTGLFSQSSPRPQTEVLFGLPGLSSKDEDFVPLSLLNHVLGGGGFSSRLLEEIREKRGLAYGASSRVVLLKDFPLLMGSFATEAGRVAESLKVARFELARMAGEGISDDELNDSAAWHIHHLPLRLTSTSRIADYLISLQYHELGMDYPQRRDSLIKAVTVEDIKRVARRVLGGLLAEETERGRRPSMLTVAVGGGLEKEGQDCAP